MGCSQWKTVRLKISTIPARNMNGSADLFLGCSHEPPPAKQLLERVGQLKLDQVGSHVGRDQPPNGSIPNDWLGALFQSVIL